MANYSTRQQKALLDCLSACDECVTAVTLADRLREAGEPIGLATVYRRLERLEAEGKIHKILTEEGAYYRYCAHEEAQDCFLLKCERCGSIAHVDCARLAPLYEHLAQEHRFVINPRRTMLYGVCGRCREETP